MSRSPRSERDISRRLRAWLPAALLAAAIPANAVSVLPADQVFEAKDLVCDLYRAGSIGEYLHRMGVGPRADLFIAIENIRTDPPAARVVTSRTAGARPVRIYQGETGMHFVEDRESSVVVTTLVSCVGWKRKGGRDLCTRYDVRSSWHFDASVHRDADAAFRRIGDGSYRGTCEPWQVS